MKRKWFSFNPENQKVEEIEITDEFFNQESNFLFWSRGLDEWVNKDKLKAYYLSLPPEVEIIEQIKPENSKTKRRI